MIFNIYSLDDDNNKNLEARFDSSSLKIETSNGELEFILNKKIKFWSSHPKFDDKKGMEISQKIKKQWGENLKKFGGIQLPGGVTLNGDVIYKEAADEIERLEKEMENQYGPPLEWFMN